MTGTDRASLVVAAGHLDRIDSILGQADGDDRAVLVAVEPELAAALDAVAQVTAEVRRSVIDDGDLLELGRLRDRIGGPDAAAEASGNAASRALRSTLATAIIEFEADVHDLIADIDDASDSAGADATD